VSKKIAPAAIQALKEALTHVYWFKSELRSFLSHSLSDPSVLGRLNWDDYKRNIVATLVDHLAMNEEVYQRDIIRLMDEVARVNDFSHLRKLDDGKDKEEKAKNAVAGGDVAKGKAIFAKCASCHGADGKTKALGKSEIIAGQPAADLEKKIQEYKAGTRNVAGMGMLMKGQVGSLSDEDIKAVAAYISSLK